MDWLNYHHLFYFWTTVREGSIAAASRKLQVGRPAISMQLRSLETALGQDLFLRRGPELKLTETGKLVKRYADDIFQRGRELVNAVKGTSTEGVLNLRVGIVDVMTKLVAFQVLLPALEMDEPVSLHCREASHKQLIADLAVQDLDLVISDIPLVSGQSVKAYNHDLGESTVSLFAAPDLARKLKRRFPRSLTGAPFLMPSGDTALRRSLETWLQEEDLHPTILHEFDDSALIKVFGQAGQGVFAAPTVVREQTCKQYGVRVLGELERVRERAYGISTERKIKHPAVAWIIDRARQNLFRGE